MKGRGMRNGLAVLAAGTILTLAVGWYQDWYRVDRAASAPGFYNLNVGIHTDKINDDYNSAGDQVRQGGQWIQARYHDFSDDAPDSSPAAKSSQPGGFDGAEESSHNHLPPAEPVFNKWK